MKQEDQAKQATWIFGKDLSNPEYFLEFANELKTENTTGQKYNVITNLNGSPTGVNISGDPNEAISDLTSLDEKSYMSGSITAEYQSDPNLKITISIIL